MKRFILFSACSFFYFPSYSQNFSLSLERQLQIAYIGFDNPLSCTVEGISCDSISLTTDNGLITKVYPCRYIFLPLKTADSKITIIKKINNKSVKIGEQSILVRNLPDPIASVGGLNGGLISKGALNAQNGIAAYPPTYLGFELHYQVKKFFITAIRNKELLFFKYVEGPAFTAEIHKLFDTLQTNDIVTFSLITVLKADGREVRANALEFNIE